MARYFLQLLLSALSILAATAKPVQKRQSTSPDIVEYYINQVKTALYVIDSLKADNATTSCSDSKLPTTLDAEGYDGGYAQQLLCEVAVGIQIFSNLDRAANDITTTLTALNNLQDPINGLPRLLSCRSISVTTLDEAGLDGAAIQDAVCRATQPSDGASTIRKTTSESTTKTMATSTTAALITPTPVPFVSATLSLTLVFSNTEAQRSGAPASPSSSPSSAGNESLLDGTALANSPFPISTSTGFLPPITNASTSPAFPTGPIATAKASTPSFVTPGPFSRPRNLTAGFDTVPLTASGAASGIVFTTISANVSLIAGTGTSSNYSMTSRSLLMMNPASAVTTETSPSIITVTAYTTQWVVGPPIAFTSSAPGTEDVTIVTDYSTTTQIIFVTSTMTARNTTQPYASGSRGEWVWTGHWCPEPWTPSTAVSSGLPLSSGLMTGSSPYGNSYGRLYGSIIAPPPVKTDACRKDS